jgi:predicted AlkP superfamily phosphohydrolase/phosphomutase
MKILIFGIDGLGKESLKALGLAKLARRMDVGVVGNPKIHNVISRGWSEIYTGKTAFETGAFYQSPELNNGRINPTQKTGLSFLKKTTDHKSLLWNRLNSMGLNVGVFTVPTVTVPEKNDGFCVGASGGGKFGNGLSSEDYYPEDLLDGLNIKDIDLGLRMGYGAYLPDSIDNLEKYANKHIADYFYLLNRVLDKNPVDVCFAASRFINEMSYKFLGVYLDEPKTQFEIELKKTVQQLCESFDAQLDDLIEKLDPDNLFIVSDHGLGRFDYEINLNQFLVEMGLIKQRSFAHWKELVRPSYYWIKKNVFFEKVGVVEPKYAFESSNIFSIGFTNVLYLNDQRFGGKTFSDDERKAYLQNLVDEFNKKVKVDCLDKFFYFELFDISQHMIGDLAVPDILCKISDGVSNTERHCSVTHAREFAFEKMFSEGFYGEHSGCKTEDTIAAYIGSNKELVNFDCLTDVYSSIIDVAEVYCD